MDSVFWNSMIKRGATHGSGGFSWYNGWLNIFFPIIKDRYNEFCDPYSSDSEWVKLKGEQNSEPLWMGAKPVIHGSKCSHFPNGLSKVPVKWIHLDQEIPLQFIVRVCVCVCACQSVKLSMFC